MAERLGFEPRSPFGRILSKDLQYQVMRPLLRSENAEFPVRALTPAFGPGSPGCLRNGRAGLSAKMHAASLPSGTHMETTYEHNHMISFFYQPYASGLKALFSYILPRNLRLSAFLLSFFRGAILSKWVVVLDSNQRSPEPQSGAITRLCKRQRKWSETTGSNRRLPAPRAGALPGWASLRKNGCQRWIRTTEGRSRQIYSLLSLTT